MVVWTVLAIYSILRILCSWLKIISVQLSIWQVLSKAQKKIGNYASCCRWVGSKRLSNGNKKGENNKKNGNKYLAWAYVEAAHFAIRHMSKAQRFYQQKMAKANGAVATKALANRLALASYFVLRDQVPFDEDMRFR